MSKRLQKPAKKPSFKKWWAWGAVAAVAMIAIAVSIHMKNISAQAGANAASTTIGVLPYTAELSSGNYTVGIDVPAGKYKLTAISGNGNVSTSNTSNNGINLTMGIDGASGLYKTEYSDIDLLKDAVLSISGGVTLRISSDTASLEALGKRDQPNKETIPLKAGTYVAGTDFPAGVYDVTAVSGNGNVFSNNVYKGGIDAFMGIAEDSLYEKAYKNISLPQGTTLTIDGVEVNLIPSK